MNPVFDFFSVFTFSKEALFLDGLNLTSDLSVCHITCMESRNLAFNTEF